MVKFHFYQACMRERPPYILYVEVQVEVSHSLVVPDTLQHVQNKL